MNRVKKRNAGVYTLTASVLDEAGQVQAVTGTLSVKIYDGDGALVLEGTPEQAEGTLTFNVAADELATLDEYRVVWTGTVNGVDQQWDTDFELVGGYLCEIADLRAARAEFENLTKYSNAKLRAARTSAEQLFERECHVAFVPRGGRHTFVSAAPRVVDNVTGSRSRLMLPTVALRKLYDVTIDGVALTADELAAVTVYPWGAIDRVKPWPAGSTIAVHYEHGYDAPEGHVTDAIIELAADGLIPSSLPARATGQSTDVGFLRFTVAGRDGATGIPRVDAAIERERRPNLVVG